MDATDDGDPATIHLNPEIVAVADGSNHVVDCVIPLTGTIRANTTKAVDTAVGVGPIGADTGDLIARQFAVLFFKDFTAIALTRRLMRVGYSRTRASPLAIARS